MGTEHELEHALRFFAYIRHVYVAAFFFVIVPCDHVKVLPSLL
jgi:hypothetical protein